MSVGAALVTCQPSDTVAISNDRLCGLASSSGDWHLNPFLDEGYPGD